MPYEYIVAAVDDTESGRHVAAVARKLSGQAGARLGVLTAIPASRDTVEMRAEGGGSAIGPLPELEQWLGKVIAQAEHDVSVTFAVVRGIPGVEIPRFAEEHGADLLVIGHTPRSPSIRLLVGDTADAVTRRSRVPCLLVPPGRDVFGPILAAVDGSRHATAVLDAACKLASVTCADVCAVTVERWRPDEAGPAAFVPLASSVKLEDEVAAAERRWRRSIQLDIRRGVVADEVLAAIRRHGARVLVTGFHRGGPPGVVEGRSTARRLVHGAAVAILTVPTS